MTAPVNKPEISAAIMPLEPSLAKVSFLFEALIGMPIRAFFADCVFMPTRFVSDLCYNRLYLHRKEG